MPTVKILSWNIQKLNEAKRTDVNFQQLIANVIVNAQADIVGIMEIVGQQGQELRNALPILLNNLDPRGGWTAQESEVQIGAPYEQYLFLWRQEVNHLAAAGLEFDLTGVLREEIFHAFGNPARQLAIFQALERDQLIEIGDAMVYKVRENKEAELRNPQQPLQVNPPPQLSAQEKQQIKQILRDSISVYFPRRRSRSPFTGLFTLGNNHAQLPVILFHAPGPGDLDKYRAINNLAHVPRVHQYHQGVIMGDFNIREHEHTVRTRWYDARRQQVPGAQPRQYVTKEVFEPIQALGYSQQLAHNQPANRTSLAPSLPPASQNSVDGRSSPYDKFLVKSNLPAVSVVPNSAQVLDLIDQIAQNTNGIQPVALAVYNQWVQPHRDRVNQEILALNHRIQSFQNRIAVADARRAQRFQNSVQVAQNLRAAQVAKLATLQPLAGVASLQQAHQIYVDAISDHLPITVEIQY